MKKHRLTAYFCLAYAITWMVALPLIAQTRGWIEVTVPFSLHYLTAYGPLLAAIIVVAMADGKGGLAQYLKNLFAWRSVPGWAWLSAISPLVIFLVAMFLTPFLGGAAPDFGSIGEVNFLPDLGFIGALLLWTFTSGLGEESGWRGFALPELQKNHNALFSATVLSLFWAGWHIPAFFYVPTYMNLTPAFIPGFLIGIFSGSVLLAWLTNGSGGSALPAVLWHGVFNFVTATRTSNGIPAAIISTAVIVWAVAILVLAKRSDLATMRRGSKRQK